MPQSIVPKGRLSSLPHRIPQSGDCAYGRSASAWRHKGNLGAVKPISWQTPCLDAWVMKTPRRQMLKAAFGIVWFIATACLVSSSASAASVLIEAEAFNEHGGWINDTQFTALADVGSPYLMAHGLGKPVANASTTIKLPEAGTWRVLARTKDWVAPWQAPGAPGRFSVVLNGQVLPVEFGTIGAEWHWQDGGKVELPSGDMMVELKDLTGFNGRCDAILLTTDVGLTPPNRDPELRSFRRQMLGLTEKAVETREYDLVVVGGGYGGIAAAISAARQGIRVALIQDRPVLGGNGSSEVRVWAEGGTMRGKFSHLGEIVEEFADRAPDCPASPNHFVDDLKTKVVSAEPNIDLFLNHYAFAADTDPKTKAIVSVTALDCQTGSEKRFRGRFFVDGTGHGHLAEFSGAAFQMTETGHMGTSNLWMWQRMDQPQEWPATPWALDLEEGVDFPKQRLAASMFEGKPYFKGEWYWESGFGQHPIRDLEKIRDWNLRALFGAFSAVRRNPANANAALRWVSAVGGPRESRRIEGDVILTRDDIVSRREFTDGCVPTTWDIDLHYPKEQFAKKFPDNPYISRAEFGSGVDKRSGYPVPYRCLYSRNVPNLFMAGRCISVTHEALGTIRVMRTGGMMGEVVGKAAYVAVKHHTTPRGVYEQHWNELAELLSQPGHMRRTEPTAALQPDPSLATRFPVAFHRPSSDRVAGNGAAEYVALDKLPGVVIDDSQAVLKGPWKATENLPGYIGDCYLYAQADSGATARFEFKVPTAGLYEIRLAWLPHANRAKKAPLVIEGSDEGPQHLTIDQTKAATDSPNGMHSLGIWSFDPEKPCSLLLSTQGAGGFVHADCVQIALAKGCGGGMKPD